jgi:acyl carrier protein
MSDYSEIYPQVEALLLQLFCTDPQRLRADARLVEDLYADSLELLDLILALNQHFSIELDADDLAAMLTLNDVVLRVQKQRQHCHC